MVPDCAMVLHEPGPLVAFTHRMKSMRHRSFPGGPTLNIPLFNALHGVNDQNPGSEEGDLNAMECNVMPATGKPATPPNAPEPDTAAAPAGSTPDAMAFAARGMTAAATLGQITQKGFAELAALQAETAGAAQVEIAVLVAQAFAANDPLAKMALPQRCADAAMRHWMAHAERSGRMGQDILSRAVAAAFAPNTKS